METAPLTLAHNHARNAALETRQNNLLAASEEHELAATEFAAAAQGSRSDSEAVRILRLLERQHLKLSDIIRHAQERPSPPPTTTTTTTATTTTATMTTTTTTMAGTAPAPAPAATAMASPAPNDETKTPSPPTPKVLTSKPPKPPRLPRAAAPSVAARDLSSSIASNLATARGIPPHYKHNNPQQQQQQQQQRPKQRPTPISPLVSNQHAEGHIAQREDNGASVKGSAVAWAPPSVPPPHHQQHQQLPSSLAPDDNDANNAPFQAFYKQVESMMSRLGAPLSFAGINLASVAKAADDEKAQDPDHAPQQQQQPKSPKPLSEPDYSQLISRAALRAVNDPRGHGLGGGGGGGGGINDSFFFVPTSGGTMSYAESLTRRERAPHARIPSTLTHISEDDFVDARSGLLPPHSAASRAASMKAAQQQQQQQPQPQQPMYDGRTMEELALRNQTLQQQLDLVTRRLHAFEMSSQSSTAALAQSIRLMPKAATSPLASPTASRTNANSASTGGGASSDNTIVPGSKQRDAAAAAAQKRQEEEQQQQQQQQQARIAELEELLRRNDARARKKDEENAKLRETLLRYREKWENLKQGARARREKEKAGGGGGGGGAGAGEGSAKGAAGGAGD